MIDWNEELETGDALIDAQHRILILYVNRLEQMGQSTNPSREEVELFVRFILFLDDFLPLHFGLEADCLHRRQCPAYENAQAAHTEFFNFYQGFKQRFGIEGYRQELVRELLAACGSFIKRHVLGSEAQLGRCKTELSGAGSN